MMEYVITYTGPDGRRTVTLAVQDCFDVDTVLECVQQVRADAGLPRLEFVAVTEA